MYSSNSITANYKYNFRFLFFVPDVRRWICDLQKWFGSVKKSVQSLATKARCFFPNHGLELNKVKYQKDIAISPGSEPIAAEQRDYTIYGDR
jgi:hypothetical protein